MVRTGTSAENWDDCECQEWSHPFLPQSCKWGITEPLLFSLLHLLQQPLGLPSCQWKSVAAKLDLEHVIAFSALRQS